jgi:hypothetical protein
MPVTTSTDSSRGVVALTFADPYSIDEWRRVMLDVIHNPVFREHGALLVDRRLAAPPTTPFVDAMVDFFGKHPAELEKMRAAIVVSDDTSFGMGRMTELRMQLKVPQASVRPFRDYDEAVRWLTTVGTGPR